MMNNTFKKFFSKEDIASKLAEDIARILDNAIAKYGKATLLLSGGNTPKLFLEKLSQIDISWKDVKVGLVDERWLESSSKDSNENLIKTHLFKNKAFEATFISMYENKDIEDTLENCNNKYKKEFERIDVLVLGMGGDAHTASLFPNNEKLDLAYDLQSDDMCINITPDTAPYDRMSLNLKAILDAKNIFLHIEGDEKLKVYDEVQNSTDDKMYPILKVLKSEQNIKVYAYE